MLKETKSRQSFKEKSSGLNISRRKNSKAKKVGEELDQGTRAQWPSWGLEESERCRSE